MKHLCWLGFSLLALNAQAADAYRLDPDQTRVSFDVWRFGIPCIRASFRRLEGEFVLDRKGSDSRIDVSVRTDSLAGLDRVWSEMLRSRDWLDTQRFPEMTFRSTHIEFDDAGGAVAGGQLTLHGVTRPVALTVSRLDCSSPLADEGNACGFAAHTRIRRSDFGLPHGFWLGGDTVDISVDGAGLRRDGGAAAISGWAPQSH